MPNSQRAKQFAPFEALHGLGAILRKAEEEHAVEQETKMEVNLKSVNKK